jgi:hypothetical protein
MVEYPIHEAANIMPLDEENIRELSENIKTHGQRVPIELLDGKIIDGRRRLKACQIIGATPVVKEVSVDDPIAYVLSLNLHRRHLNESQRAMVAARARKFYDDAAKQRQKEGGSVGGKVAHASVKGVESLPQASIGRSRDLAGKALGVSGKSVDYASRVQNCGTPKLQQAVDAGKVSVSYAARMTTLPTEKQDEIAENAKVNKPRPRINDLLVPKQEEKKEETKVAIRGVGVIKANEAINHLCQIPLSDPLRSRGFQIVMDWIKANR